MTVRISSNLSEQLLGSDVKGALKSLKEIFLDATTGCNITFYTSAQPADADNIPPGTVIGIATGVKFDDAVDGIIEMTSPVPPIIGQPAAGAAGLNAGWGRIHLPTDDTTEDGTNKLWPRLDFSCGATTGDVVFPGGNTLIKNGSTNNWNYLRVKQPRGT